MTLLNNLNKRRKTNVRSNIFSGFLFDKHWESAMRKLKPKQFYQLFWEFYDYHMSAGSIKIPSHHEDQRLETMVSLIQPQIKKRLCCARVFGKGGELSRDAHGDAHSDTHGVAHSAAVCDAPIVREGKGKECNRMDCMGVEGSGDSDAVPLQEGDFPTLQDPPLPPPPQEKEIKNKKGYGEKNNVMLTEEEYARLTGVLGIPLAYVDKFSEKLASHPYQYSDHAKALAEWWEQDKGKPQWSYRGKSDAYAPQNYQSSFDTQDFYNAAVRKSMGDIVK